MLKRCGLSTPAYATVPAAVMMESATSLEVLAAKLVEHS